MVWAKGEPEEPADAVHHRGDREVDQPGVAELSAVQLIWTLWIPASGSSPLVSHQAHQRFSW